MACPADRTRAGEPPDRACTELNLGTDPRELCFPELRVVTDSNNALNFICPAFTSKDASRQQNTRDPVIEDCSASMRLDPFRKPPFSHL